MGIGIDRIRQVTCSASAISSLTEKQIQDIINHFSKKSIDTNECQKMIGVINYNAHVIKPSSSNNVSNTKVSISDEETKSRVSNSLIPLESSINSKKLLEAEISRKPRKLLYRNLR